MNRTSFILLFSISCLSATAQPSVDWQNKSGIYGYNCMYSVAQANDGGYILAGGSQSERAGVPGHHGNNDFCIEKTNGNGEEQWRKFFGGSGDETALSVKPTMDGGYVVAGSSQSTDGDVTGNHGGFDYWILKLNASGNIQWQKCFGGKDDEFVNSIVQTSDGGYVVSGCTNSNDGDVHGNHGLTDAWIVKLNSSGIIEWEKTFGDAGVNVSNSIQATTDGGFIFSGWSQKFSGNVRTDQPAPGDFWVVKLSGSGKIQWEKNMGGSGEDIAQSVQQTSDGGFVVAGYSESKDGDVLDNYGGYDCWIVKLNFSGTVEWKKSVGSACDDLANSVIQSSDGGFVIAGYSASNDKEMVANNPVTNDFLIVKLSKTGDIEWQKKPENSENDLVRCILQTTDGDFVVTGSASSSVTDRNGNRSLTDFWIAKLGADEDPVNERHPAFFSFDISPNPARHSTTISFPLLQEQILLVEIVDVSGKEIKIFLIHNSEIGPYMFTWNLTDDSGVRVDDGIYVVKITGNDFSETRKMAVIK